MPNLGILATQSSMTHRDTDFTNLHEVILMARQCEGGRTRAEALRPRLTNPSLKVFSTLILDAATARSNH